MRVVNTDSKSHSAKTPEKCLQEADREKKKIYLEACLQQLRNFSPFVAPRSCNVCNTTFYICNDLDCKRDGIVMERHN